MSEVNYSTLKRSRLDRQCLFTITAAEIKVASFIVWTVLSVIMLFILLMPFFLSHDRILQLAPNCVSRIKYNRECSLCGMSHAFIAISEGKIRHAYSYNKAAIPTYVFFAFNELIFLGLILMTAIKKPKTGKELKLHCS